MVSLGSSLLTIAGLSLSLHDSSAVSRVLQGLVAGIGFVGGGAILRSKTSGEVEGLTTATSVWVVAAIGIATGLGLLLHRLVLLGRIPTSTVAVALSGAAIVAMPWGLLPLGALVLLMGLAHVAGT